MSRKRSKVTPLRTPATSESTPPQPVTVRWVVPRGHVFPLYQHAHLIQPTVAQFTICKAHHVEGAIYPPSRDVPRCKECEAGIATGAVDRPV